MVLPLVNIERVLDLFLLLKELYTSDIEKRMIGYFETNFITGRYKIECWNLHKIAVKSNNSVESFHAMINKFIDISHPSLHKFIKELYDIIEKERLNVFEVMMKQNVRRSKNEEIIKNKQLETIITEEDKYGDADLLIFLKKTSKFIDQNFDDDFAECDCEDKHGVENGNKMTCEGELMKEIQEVLDCDDSEQENEDKMICGDKMEIEVINCDDDYDEECEMKMIGDNELKKMNGDDCVNKNEIGMICDNISKKENEDTMNCDDEFVIEPVIITYGVYDPSKIVSFEPIEEHLGDNVNEPNDSSYETSKETSKDDSNDSSDESTSESSNQSLGSKKIKVRSDKGKKVTKKKKRTKKTLNQRMKDFVDKDIDENVF